MKGDTTHSRAGEVTNLGVEKPPEKSQVGVGHHYCLGQQI